MFFLKIVPFILSSQPFSFETVYPNTNSVSKRKYTNKTVLSPNETHTDRYEITYNSGNIRYISFTSWDRNSQNKTESANHVYILFHDPHTRFAEGFDWKFLGTTASFETYIETSIIRLSPLDRSFLKQQSDTLTLFGIPFPIVTDPKGVSQIASLTTKSTYTHYKYYNPSSNEKDHRSHKQALSKVVQTFSLLPHSIKETFCTHSIWRQESHFSNSPISESAAVRESVYRIHTASGIVTEENSIDKGWSLLRNSGEYASTRTVTQGGTKTVYHNWRYDPQKGYASTQKIVFSPPESTTPNSQSFFWRQFNGFESECISWNILPNGTIFPITFKVIINRHTHQTPMLPSDPFSPAPYLGIFHTIFTSSSLTPIIVSEYFPLTSTVQSFPSEPVYRNEIILPPHDFFRFINQFTSSF